MTGLASEVRYFVRDTLRDGEWHAEGEFEKLMSLVPPDRSQRIYMQARRKAERANILKPRDEQITWGRILLLRNWMKSARAEFRIECGVREWRERRG